jgi:hypothetical protein
MHWTITLPRDRTRLAASLLSNALAMRPFTVRFGAPMSIVMHEGTFFLTAPARATRDAMVHGLMIGWLAPHPSPVHASRNPGPQRAIGLKLRRDYHAEFGSAERRDRAERSAARCRRLEHALFSLKDRWLANVGVHAGEDPNKALSHH